MPEDRGDGRQRDAATPKLWRRPRGWAWGPVMPARCMSSRTWRVAVWRVDGPHRAVSSSLPGLGGSEAVHELEGL